MRVFIFLLLNIMLIPKICVAQKDSYPLEQWQSKSTSDNLFLKLIKRLPDSGFQVSECTDLPIFFDAGKAKMDNLGYLFEDSAFNKTESIEVILIEIKNISECISLERFKFKNNSEASYIYNRIGGRYGYHPRYKIPRNWTWFLVNNEVLLIDSMFFEMQEPLMLEVARIMDEIIIENK